MRAIVSSTGRFSTSGHQKGNCRAVVGLGLLIVLLAHPATAAAQAEQEQPPAEQPSTESRGASIAKFFGGAAIGLATHEAGHLLFDAIFNADPGVRKVGFHGVPFFAITHDSGLPRHQEFVISSAGFWVQHAENEWLLSKRPRFRHEHAPVAKGVFAFNVLASIAYSGAAFAKTGPEERDTRGMAESSRTDERVIGALILAPALLDAWRYYHPDAAWAAWASRGVKIGLVVLVVR